MTISAPPPLEISVEDFEAVEAEMPETVQAEFVNGRIIVVPAPDGDHSEVAGIVARQIFSRDASLWLFEERGLHIPSYRATRARADGAVAPIGYFRGQKSWADPSGVLLVLEVTSGSEQDAEVDRVEKRDAYAQAELPVYLLVDRHKAEVVVHWEPKQGRYLHESRAAFGAPLPLPEPFGFDLDTTELA